MPFRVRPAVLALLAFAVLLPGRAAAQGLEEVKARYTKYEYRTPMRDGKRLFTAVYVPPCHCVRPRVCSFRTRWPGS